MLERQFEVVTQVGAAKHLAPAAAAPRTEDIAEHIAEDVTEIGAAKTATTTHAALLESGVAHAVVRGTLLCVAEYFVSFGRLLEFFFGVLVIVSVTKYGAGLLDIPSL